MRAKHLLLLVGVVVACESQGPLEPLPDRPISIDPHERLLRDYVRAVEGRSYEDYAALLSETFEFVPAESGGACFPWLQPEYWSGGSSQLCWNGDIFLDISILAIETSGSQSALISDAAITYMLDGHSGFVREARLAFEMDGSGGDLLIAEIVEVVPL